MDGKLITHPNDLTEALRTRSAFRTHAATGVNHTRYDFGTFHGHPGLLPDPMWDELSEATRANMSDRFRWVTGSLSDDHTGHWYSDFWESYNSVNNPVDFVVYSYDTIIGWHVGDTIPYWVVTTTVHSATTSLHQTRLIQVIQQLGESLK